MSRYCEGYDSGYDDGQKSIIETILGKGLSGDSIEVILKNHLKWITDKKTQHVE